MPPWKSGSASTARSSHSCTGTRRFSLFFKSQTPGASPRRVFMSPNSILIPARAGKSNRNKKEQCRTQLPTSEDQLLPQRRHNPVTLSECSQSNAWSHNDASTANLEGSRISGPCSARRSIIPSTWASFGLCWRCSLLIKTAAIPQNQEQPAPQAIAVACAAPRGPRCHPQAPSVLSAGEAAA